MKVGLSIAEDVAAGSSEVEADSDASPTLSAKTSPARRIEE